MSQTNLIPLKQLISQATNYLIELGYSKVSVYNYKWTWRHLLDFAEKCNVEYFTLEFGMEFLEKVYSIQDFSNPTKYEKHKIRRIKVLNDFMCTGKISRHYRIKPIYIPSQFAAIYQKYGDYLNSKHQKERTISTKLFRVNICLQFFDEKNIEKIDLLTQSNIIDLLSFLNLKYSSAARSNILFSLRDFLKWSSQYGQIPKELANLLPVIYTNKHERLPSFFSKDELKKLLDCVDRKTASGKRNYLILLLAIELGMRASDINNLTFENIRWEKNLIEFIQQKTGVYLQLPLTDSIKFAFLDYMKNSRPNSSNNHVFLRQVAPHIPYANGTAFHNIVNKYLKLAEIPIDGKRHGLHSLRHSLAGNLLIGKTSLPVISGVLGHSSTEITNEYLRIDMNLLRTAALEV